MVYNCYLRLSYATETDSCRLLLLMAKMELDCNLKKLGQFFQVLMPCLQKSPKNLLWLALPDKIYLISSS